MLIPLSDWESERGRYLSLLGLPATAEPFLERLNENLKAGLAVLEEAREAGRATIGKDGALRLSAFEALPTDEIPRRTRDLLFKAIGIAQFADLMMEDVRTGFSEVLLARKARDANELVSLYGALMAHGTEIDAKGVAAMIQQVDAAAISNTMRVLEMSGRLSRANARVVEFQRTQPITELWGTGQRASSDSMSLDTSPHLFYARVDPRRRTHAVGIYTHVLDQRGIVYNQPIVLNERQAGVAIEGAVRHSDTREDGGLLALAVDTHGYTSVGMAVSARLRSMSAASQLVGTQALSATGYGRGQRSCSHRGSWYLTEGHSRRLGRATAARCIHQVRACQRRRRVAAIRQRGARGSDLSGGGTTWQTAAAPVPVRLFQQRRVSPGTARAAQSR